MRAIIEPVSCFANTGMGEIISEWTDVCRLL